MDAFSMDLINCTTTRSKIRLFGDLFPTKPVRISTIISYIFLLAGRPDFFGCPRTLLRFVKNTEKESPRAAKRYDDLQKSRLKRPKYKEVTIPNFAEEAT